MLTESAVCAPKNPSPAPKPAATASPTAPAAAPFVLPDPVATIDGQPVTKSELEHITDLLLASSGHSLANLSTADQKKAYRSVLSNLIIDRLVTAQAANVKVDPMAVQVRLDQLRRQYPSQEAFDSEIKKSGQTMETVTQNVHNQIAREQWMDSQIASQIVVTPQEVEKFYNDGPPNKFDEPERVSASHILIKVRRDAPPEESLAAEKRANEVVDRLKKGEKFEDVALQVSGDPTVKTNQGNLGAFTRDGVMPEFADAAFKLKVGEVSAPVRTQFGYHIIKLNDRTAAHTDTLDEARERIKTYIEGQKRQKATAELLIKLRDAAKIVVATDLRDDPAAASPRATAAPAARP